MAHSTTPHTQTQQDTRPDQSDLEPDQLEQTAGTGPDAELHRNREGAQTGTNSGLAVVSGAGRHPSSEPPTAAHQGRTTTRTPEGETQGITSHPAKEESARQQNVVKDRPDAQAGLNQNR